MRQIANSMAQVLPFPNVGGAAVSPIDCFIRVGEAHRKLADLYAAGRLPARRIVIDASRHRHQRELITALRDAGAEVVLDTEIAELASRAKCAGHSRNAPWAPGDGRPLGPDYFQESSPSSDVIGSIARFAITERFDTVLAPTHFLGDPTYDNWLDVDRRACQRLRRALDSEGGSHITIDYPLILPHVMLNDTAARGAIVASLADLPVENVWFRASGLGPDAGPLTLRRYLLAISALHNLGKPVIADYLGGLTSLASLAFGVVSGLSHGIGERERFDAGGWHKSPPPRDDDAEFGRTVRVSIPGVGRSATLNELDVLASARGGRRLVACGDPGCCLHGYSDMISDPRRHSANQLFKAISDLERVPDLRRETYFLEGPMTDADRLARQIRLLRPSIAEANRRKVDLGALMKRFEEHSHRLGQTLTMLEDLHQLRGDEGPRVIPLRARYSSDNKTKESRR
jgi:hypothetical protein